MKEFLNAKSMATPGIAGAVAMLITNTLVQQFELPGKWIALGLSFLLGTLVFSDRSSAIWQRGLLYVLNSLIIFAMAVGTNATGRAATAAPHVNVRHFVEVLETRQTGFFGAWP
jgi:hypothetical protein